MAASACRVYVKYTDPETGKEAKERLRVELDWTVENAAIQIGLQTGLLEDDYGLYITATEFRKGRWLEPNKSLDFYSVSEGDVFEFRRRFRPVSVRLADGTTKLVVVDDSAVVSEVIFVVAERVDVHNPEEYGLKREGSGSVEWLAPGKTLAEQGVGDDEVLFFGQRLHFTEKELNMNDEAELEELYEQCKGQVHSGVHSLTLEEAVELASYECQAQFGDSEDGRTVDLNGIIAPAFKRHRGIAGMVKETYASIAGTTGAQAMFQYVSVCRGLPTWGVTFFKVEEVNDEGLVVPLLLGVSKSKILKLDYHTKEILDDWPLEHLARWAGTSSTFTLDFGSFQETYVSFQTAEGDAIKVVVDAYMEKLKGEADTGGAAVADTTTTTGGNASSSTAAAGTSRTSTVGGAKKRKKRRRKPKNTGPERGLAGEIIHSERVTTKLDDAGLNELNDELEHTSLVLSTAAEELDVAPTPAPATDDDWLAHALETVRASIVVQVENVAISAASMVGGSVMTDASHFDGTIVQMATRNLGDDAAELVTACRAFASLMGQQIEGQMVVDVCRSTVHAMMRLVSAVMGACAELAHGKADMSMRDEVLAACNALGTAIWQLLLRGQAGSVTEEHYNVITSHMDYVAKAITVNVGCAKVITDPMLAGPAVDRITASSTLLWTGATQLVSACKICVPTITSEDCLEQLILNVDVVREYGDGLLQIVEAVGCVDEQIAMTREGVRRLNIALNKLVSACKAVGIEPTFEELLEQKKAALQAAMSRMNNATTVAEMMHYAKEAGELARDIINMIEEADLDDDDLREALLAAARALGDATAAMIMAARNAAQSPDNPVMSQYLRDATSRLTQALSSISMEATLGHVEHVVEDVEVDFGALIAAAREAGARLQTLAATAAN